MKILCPKSQIKIIFYNNTHHISRLAAPYPVGGEGANYSMLILKMLVCTVEALEPLFRNPDCFSEGPDRASVVSVSEMNK